MQYLTDQKTLLRSIFLRRYRNVIPVFCCAMIKSAWQQMWEKFRQMGERVSVDAERKESNSVLSSAS